MKTKKRGKGRHRICAWMLTFAVAGSLLTVPAKKVEAQSDTTSNVNTETEYNFAKLLQESLYFYDANMCGEIEGTCALDWRGNCHLADKTASYKGKTVDVSGGYHDAGDHDKFGLPQGYSASILGIGYYEFKEAYEELGQSAHFKKILDHFCDYFVRCTVLDGSGNAEAFCYQVGDGASHSQWVSAEKENIDRPAYFADASDPATDQVSEAAAALAIHYVNFGNQEYLDYAKKLFALAKNSSKAAKASNGGNFYASSSWADDYCLAAAWLYKATGDSMYQSEYNSYKGQLNSYCWPSWDGVDAYAAAYGEGNWGAVSQNAESTINGCQTLDNGYRWLAQWGSARYNCNMQLEGLIYDKNKGGDTYSSWATGQMKFLIGNNNNKQCFVVGYNDHSTKYPHHRTSSGYAGFPSDGNATTPQAHVLIGALAGGIGCEQFGMYEYHDRSDDYYCNEVAIDYNAAFTGAAAALYLHNKNKSGIAATLASESELKAIGVKKYYGISSSEPEVEADGVSLNESTLELKEGETFELKATVKPDNASDKSVTWTSENTAVASVVSVDSKGVVKAEGVGTTTITVKTKNGKTAVCKVAVTAAPTAMLEASVSKVELAKQVFGYDTEPEQDIVLNNRGTAKANQMTYSFKNGENSKFKVISVQDYAEVGDSVTLTIKAQKGLAAGTYTDTLVIGYNNGVSDISLEIPVSFTVTKKKVTLTVSDVSCVYEEKIPAFSGTFTDENGEALTLTDMQISYTTTPSDTVYAGEYKIGAVVSGNDNYEVEVVEGDLTIAKKVITDIDFPIAGDIKTGETLSQSELTGGDTKYGEFSWKTPGKTMTSNDEMAEVVLKLNNAAKNNYEFSKVEGYDPETETITRNVDIQVLKEDQKTITFPTASAIKVGQQLKDSELIGGSTEYGTFEWQNPETVMETAGKIKANVVFTPSEKTEEKYGNQVTIKEVYVMVEEVDQPEPPEPEKTEITLNRTSLNLKEGNEFTLTATITPEEASGKTLIWTSGDKTVATVDLDGVVKAVGKGNTTITVATADGDASAVCEVQVTAATVNLSDAVLKADGEAVTIPSQVYGYNSTDDIEKTIAITNTGETQATNVTASFKSLNDSKFMVASALGNTIASEKTVNVMIEAKTGLAAGTYKDTLLINYYNGNEDVSLEIPVTFTVSKKSVTVTVKDASKVYGAENPTFSGTVTDAEGNKIPSSDLKITYSTEATKTSPVGAYDVTAVVDENGNYDVDVVTGVLTIRKKIVTKVVFPSAADITAGKALKESELTDGDTIYGTFAWKSPEEIMTLGSQEAEVVLTLNASSLKNYDFNYINGYEEASGTITQNVEIYVAREGEIAITFPTAAPIRVGQKLGESVLVGGSTEYGTFEWQNPETVMKEVGIQKCNVVFTPNAETANQYGNEVRINPVLVSVEKAENANQAPQAIVTARTANSITVLDLGGIVEFSLDGKSWQKETVFTDLNAFSRYEIYTRYAETENNAAGAVSKNPTVVYTLVEDPYTIDVSKLADTDYVDALKTVEDGENTHETVTYSGSVLTLLDPFGTQDTGYTITGKNENVTIKTDAKNYKILLDEAEVKALDLDSSLDVEVEINGDVTVMDSMVSTNSTNITISGSGNLTAKTMETEGDITICGVDMVVEMSGNSKAAGIAADGTISIGKGTTVTTAGGSNAAGIRAGEIVISGGTVTAKGGSYAAGIQAEQIVISGGDVTVTGGNNADGIAAEQVNITGGKVTAAGTGTGAAITGNKKVSLLGGTVKVTAEEGAIAAIVAGEKGIILVDKATLLGDEDSMFSVEPIDINGGNQTFYVITYQIDDGDGWMESVTKGENITLPKVSDKQGYLAGWEDNDGTFYPSGQQIENIQADMTFKRVYQKILISGIKITASSVTAKIGSVITFHADVTPSSVLDDSVEWNSSNPKVASVDETGKLTAIAAGYTEITATAKDGSGIISNKVKIKVEADDDTNDNQEPGNQPNGGDTSDPDDKPNEGDTSNPDKKPDGGDNQNGGNNPAADQKPNTDNKTVENNNGVLNPQPDVNNAQASSFLVTAKVKNASDVPLKASFKLAPKKSMQLQVTFLPEGVANQTLIYSSSNEEVVKVSSTGKITAGKKAGKAVVSIISEKGLKKTLTIQVMKKAVTKVTIKGAKDIKKGKTLKLKASVAPGNAGNGVYWKSSNKKIATVDANGKVKALKKGNVKITAIATDGSGKKATVKINVK